MSAIPNFLFFVIAILSTEYVSGNYRITILNTNSNEINPVENKDLADEVLPGNLLSSVIADFFKSFYSKDPDFAVTPEDAIRNRGFLPELHFVTTEDGYIIQLFRVINPQWPANQTTCPGRYPIVVAHGIYEHGMDYLVVSPGGFIDEDPDVVGGNLAFELSKRGYDVWVMNFRGTIFSTNHTTLDTESLKFWNFSFQEYIEYDMPAIIPYVLKKTGSPTVGYIGFSQATQAMFGLLSRQPEFNSLIKPFIALGPVAFLSNAVVLRSLGGIAPLIEFFDRKGGRPLPDEEIVATIKRHCGHNRFFTQVCGRIFEELNHRFFRMDINATRIPIYASISTMRSTVKNLIHMAQLSWHGKFAAFDYGDEGNMEMYGSIEPPEYPLEKITNPYIILFSSIYDFLANPSDVRRLKRRLKGALIREHHIIDRATLSHLSYIFGRFSPQFVITPVLASLKRVICP